MEKIVIVDPSSRSMPYCYNYAISLSRFYDVEIFCSSGKFNNEFLDDLESRYNVNVRKFNIYGANKVIGIFNYFCLMLTLFLKKRNYSYIHFQWSIMPCFEVYFYKILGKKIRFTFHNDVPHGFKNKIYRPYKKIASLTNKVSFVSSSTRDSFIKNYGKEFKGKSYIFKHGYMPFGLNKNDVRDFKEKSIKTIVFCGNVKKYKGIEFLLNCVDCIKSLGLRLEIYGKFDVDQLKYKDEFLKKNVHVVDEYLSVNDLEILFSRMDVALVLPYIKATQSGIMYNAIFYSLPFIGTNTGDICEYLSGISCEKFLFEYNDIESFYKSLKHLKENHQKLSEMINTSKYAYNWDYDRNHLDQFYS